MNGVTLHCLRHTGATRALQAGASVRTVMDLGDWQSPTMVMRYAHASDADVRAAAESISGTDPSQSRNRDVTTNARNRPSSTANRARVVTPLDHHRATVTF